MSKDTFKKVRGFAIFLFILVGVGLLIIFPALNSMGYIGTVAVVIGVFASFFLPVVVGTLVISSCTERFYRNYYERLPERTARARVLAKTTESSGGGVAPEGHTHAVITHHFVSFEFNSRRENFVVDVSVFNTLIENETGVLTYKETEDELLFIDFKRDSRT